MRQPDYKMVQGGNYTQHINPQIAGAAGKGLARLGKTLTDVGVDAGDVVHKLHLADNDRQMVEEQQKWEDAYAGHQKEMLDNRNSPLDWQTSWDAKAQKMMDSRETTEMSRDLRARMNLTFMKWNGGVSRDIGQKAHQTVYQNTANSIKSRYKQQQLDGNWSGAAATIQGAGDYLPDWEKEAALASNDRHEKHGMITADIDTDPHNELEAINGKEGKYEAMDNPTRLKYRDDAERRIAELENKEIDDFNVMRANGEIQTQADFDALDHLGAWKGLSQRRKEVLRAGITRTTDATLDEQATWFHKAGQLERQIDNGELTKKQQGDAYLDLKAFADSLPPDDQRARMLKVVDGLSPFNKKRATAPGGTKSSYLKQGNNEIDEAMEAGVFGKYHNSPRADRDSRDGSKNSKGNVAGRELQNKMARRKAYDAKRKFEAWMKRNPNPSNKEYTEFVESLTGREITTRSPFGAPDTGYGVLPSKELNGLVPPP